MKTSANTGSTMAAISLLRSAGVFPSNRAITFKLAHAVAFASTENFVARLSLRRRGARASEVCRHVEAQADECAARRRYSLHAGRRQRAFWIHGRRRHSRRRDRRAGVRVRDAFEFDRVDDDELVVGLDVAYEAPEVRVRALDRERDADAGEDALHDARRSLFALGAALVGGGAGRGLLKLRVADAAADAQAVLEDETVQLFDDSLRAAAGLAEVVCLEAVEARQNIADALARVLALA